MTGRSRLRFDDPVRRRIVELHETNRGRWTHIARLAQVELGDAAPQDWRTVRTIVQEYEKDELARFWTFTPESAEDAPYVFPVVRELIRRTGGRLRRVTNDEARYLGLVSRTFPTIGPWGAYLVARQLIREREAGIDWSAEHDYLALAPWDDATVEGWRHAIARGWVHPAPPHQDDGIEFLHESWSVAAEELAGLEVPHVPGKPKGGGR
jgi:hypothetical protein